MLFGIHINDKFFDKMFSQLSDEDIIVLENIITKFSFVITR